jgi:hypothetical protein
MESVLNFCVKSVREWKIEGCFKFVENAMGDCNRKRGRGDGFPHSQIFYVIVIIRVERALRKG